LTVSERIHTFGPAGSLVGVVTLPPGDDGDPGAGGARPFVLLLNAGLVHRAGPFGMHVQLARRLAERGFRVLRFDQAGLGDSAGRSGAAINDQRAVLDARDAMDSLRVRYGAQRFVAGGLCSGALNAHRVCLDDARVVGVWLLDGYAYPTRAYYRRLVKSKLVRPETWVASARRALTHAKGKLDTLRGPSGAEASAPASTPLHEGDARASLFYVDWPPQKEARKGLETMLERGARILFVYSGGWSKFVAEEQFDEMFPRLARRQQVTVRYQRHADHTYVSLHAREAMFRNVEEFLRTIPEAMSPGER
jgi:pimeloyl-ACP methyl ester carboxylesterase